MIHLLILFGAIFAMRLGDEGIGYYNFSRMLPPEQHSNDKNPQGATLEERRAMQLNHEQMRQELNYTSYPFNVRATKGMYSRGYNKVRLSVITRSRSPPSGMAWEYSNQFSWKWTDNYLHTSIVEVKPGKATTFTIDGNDVTIKLPEENKAVRGIFFADPCFTGASCCCAASQSRDYIFNRHTDMLNTLSQQDDIDFWYIGGDNFYDDSDYWTKTFFEALNTEAKTKMNGMVLGNHDYWLMGNQYKGRWQDQLGIGMTQYYAQDTLSAVYSNNGIPFNWDTDPTNKYTWGPPPVDEKNAIWWVKIGNLGILGYSGAYRWDQYEGYVDQACQAFSNDEGVKFLLVLSHWDNRDTSYGEQWEMDAPSFVGKMKNMGSCAPLKYRLKYIDGHDHNNVCYSDGWKIGANGYDGGGWGGKVGQLYVRTTDSGETQAWYIEFSNKGSSHYDQFLNCVKAKSLDRCLDQPNVWLWFDSGPPLSPSCYAMLDKQCVFKGQSASCGDRIAWLESNEGMTWDEAYEQVKKDCGRTCTCDLGPTPKPTSPPPTPSMPCDEMLPKQACDHDGCHSCGDRINWLEGQGETPAQAYAQVAKEFPDICVCSNPPKAATKVE